VSWIQDLWKLLETVASLTKDLERLTTEVKELRTDVNSLTVIVTELKADLTHEKETTQLVLDGHKKDICHIKESLDAKFQVLTSKLDLTVQGFAQRLPNSPDGNFPPSLPNDENS
jgi:regulator of replication initiation timing